jgi:hypothetical protein
LARAFPDRSNKAWKLHEDRNTTAEEKYKHYGLLYAKVPKTASSTAAAVALRIARKHSVSVAYDHSWPIEHDYGKRHPTQSFLWASIRDPAQRAISYLSDQASRKQQEQSLIGEGTLLHQLKDMDRARAVVKSEGRGGPQLYYSSLEHIPQHSAWKPSHPNYVLHSQRVKENVRNVLQQYDFLLVTERMDESLVAMALLLGLDVADVLVFDAKVSKSASGSSFSTFLPIHSSNGTMLCVPLLRIDGMDTPAIRLYLTSDEWHAMNYGDYLLHAAANASLDLTIRQTLGRERFEQALVEYRKLLSDATNHCSDRVHWPCSSTGVLQLQKASENCHRSDSGCGYQCIDEIVEIRKKT